MNGYIMSRSGEIEVFEVLDTIADCSCYGDCGII